MTAYELIQRLAKFPPDAIVRHGVDWSDDVIVDDADLTDGPPTLILTTTYSSNGSGVKVAA